MPGLSKIKLNTSTGRYKDLEFFIQDDGTILCAVFNILESQFNMRIVYTVA